MRQVEIEPKKIGNHPIDEVRKRTKILVKKFSCCFRSKYKWDFTPNRIFVIGKNNVYVLKVKYRLGKKVVLENNSFLVYIYKKHGKRDIDKEYSNALKLRY